MRMNHCSEISGSIRSPERCEYGTVWTYSSRPTIKPVGVQRCDHRLLRRGRGKAREAAGGSRHQAVLADHADRLEPVPAADLEVVGVVSGRDLQAAGAELTV